MEIVIGHQVKTTGKNRKVEGGETKTVLFVFLG